MYNECYGKFELNPRYEFHLYINSAPCGNARIFNPNREFDFPENELLINELRIKLPYDSSSASYFQSVSITKTSNQRIHFTFQRTVQGH